MGGKGLLAAFGQVIKEARLGANLSQEELGFNAGLNRNYGRRHREGTPQAQPDHDIFAGEGIGPVARGVDDTD